MPTTHFLDSPWLYLLFFALTAVSSAVGAFLSAYFRQRGTTFATKADFDTILEQLRQSTRLSEEIKAELHSRTSLQTLVRERTETLVIATFDLDQWLSQVRAHVMNGREVDFDGSPMSKISTFRDMYFPEIDGEFLQLRERFMNYVGWLIELQQVQLRVHNDPVQMQPHLDRFSDVYRPFYAALEPFRSRVIAIARERGAL